MKMNTNPIFDNISQFENEVSSFIESIQKFDPKLNSMTRILELNNKISGFNKDLESILKFNEIYFNRKNFNQELNGKLMNVLNELNLCKQKLLKLPYLYEDETELMKYEYNKNKENGLKIDELLKYSSKLSKFSTIPTQNADFYLNIGPQNYIWPAADSLRKGMLALASIKKAELIKIDKTSDDVNLGANKDEKDEKHDEPQHETHQIEEEEEYGHHVHSNNDRFASEEVNDYNEKHDVGLDLFDSEDEDD